MDELERRRPTRRTSGADEQCDVLTSRCLGVVDERCEATVMGCVEFVDERCDLVMTSWGACGKADRMEDDDSGK